MSTCLSPIIPKVSFPPLQQPLLKTRKKQKEEIEIQVETQRKQK